MSLLAYGLVALAIITALGGIGYKIHDSGYKSAQLACAEEKEAQRKADEAAQQILDNQWLAAAQQLEKARGEKRIVYRTITQSIDKYIDRPVYRNVCLDADGLRDANAALSGATLPAKPADSVPATPPTR